MISWTEFLHMATNPEVLNKPIDRDPGQLDVVRAGVGDSLYVVAGPGSGKTTALSLRALKLIFVDGVDPGAIVATTFTRRAAAELRSRILGWGDKMRQAALETRGQDTSARVRLSRLDLNKVTTGTLDSIAEQILTDFRNGAQPPVVLEEFVANAHMQRSGLWAERRHENAALQEYIAFLRGETRRRSSGRDMLETCRDVRDRFLHDQVDVAAFRAAASSNRAGVDLLCQVIEDYARTLESHLVMDFAALEQLFLDRLRSGALARFLEDLRIILVDEYQDTNLLQEQIYFVLARAVSDRGGSITVVGDDDQSLYRFRGATVDLFAQFRGRLRDQCGIDAAAIYLSNNYRSTDGVVKWCKDFIELDPAYGPVRAQAKPELKCARTGSYVRYPVLGMFRPDVTSLARDLAEFIHRVFNGPGVTVRCEGQSFHVVKNADGGSIGDSVLLCASPREYGSNGRERLPLLLRRELSKLPSPIEVFNPRGEEFARIESVQRLCGLMLECIKPELCTQPIGLPPALSATFEDWRSAARSFVSTHPAAPAPAVQREPRPYGRAAAADYSLSRFVQAWQSRAAGRHGRWPREVPLTHLLYQLVAWLPEFQDDPEGLVYLEVITRAITQAARYSAYSAAIWRDEPHASRSIRAAVWDVFVPLASGVVDINEDLIEVLPRDRLSILSIHQAKGLEFPLTIVDVGSDFRQNRWNSQGFKRFPLHSHESGIHASAPILEDVLRPFSPLGAPGRSARDREFDDLVRLYFVAFSRAQDVLLLVGLCDGNGAPLDIPNVATGWTRDGGWPCRGLPGVVQL